MSVQFTRGRVDIGVMSDALANVVARSVRAERARRGLSQSELGALLGWSQTKVSQVESGARRLYAHELPEVCTALEISLIRLLEGASREDLEALGLASIRRQSSD
jgi:transcriptional regulator with XRE-family HTH domain